MRPPSGGTARRSSAPRTSPPPSSAPRPRGSRRSSSCRSTPTPSPPPPRFPRSAKRRSGQGDELRVVLVGALELQELVVAAPVAVGVLARDAGPRVVDAAAARFLVEQRADRVEHGVLLVA